MVTVGNNNSIMSGSNGCGSRSSVKDVMSMDRRMDRRMERHERLGVIQIRKVRKWHQLQSKRSIPTSSSSSSSNCNSGSMAMESSDHNPASNGIASSTSGSISLMDLCQRLCRATKDTLVTLRSLQEGISNQVGGSPSDGNSEELDEILSHCGLVLLQRLSNLLLSNVEEEAWLSAQCLTNLAASSTSSSSSCSCSEEDGYYGPGTSWCTLMVQSESQVLSAWITVVRNFLQSPPPSSSSKRRLVEQCCWALGNMAGDSSLAREELLRNSNYKEPVVGLLQQCCQHGLGLTDGEGELVRNAAWALGNLARGADTSAWIFVNDNTPSLLTQLLSVQQSPKNKQMVTETMWWLAFLTARETEVCQLFLSHPPLVSAILFRLGSVAHVLNLVSSYSAAGPSTLDNLTASMALAIPTLRTVGNLASSSSDNSNNTPSAVQTLFAAPATIHPGNTMTCSFGSCAESLARIVTDAAHPPRHCHQHHNLSTVAMEATWVISTILPSTQPSQPQHVSLVQAVISALISPTATLDLKREALSTLAHSVPDKSILIHNNQHTIGSIISTCVHVLTCPDANAIQSALLLIQQLLQLNNNNTNDTQQIKILCEEANIVDALEHICDQASHAHMGTSSWPHHNNHTNNADLAADLLDDYFDTNQDLHMDDDDHHHNYNNTIPTFTTQNGTQFGFGIPVPTTTTTTATAPIMGRGRGRGKVLPAWMQTTPQPKTV